MSKKLGLISLLLFVILIALSGCSSSSSTSNTKNPSVSEIAEAIKQVTDISEMRIMDTAGLKKLYDISSDELEDFSLLTAPSNIEASEIAIFKVKDSSQVDSIKEKITKRIDKQAKSFKDYLPEEFYLIEHNIVKVKGNYLVMIISKDAEKISNAFEEAFK